MKNVCVCVFVCWCWYFPHQKSRLIWMFVSMETNRCDYVYINHSINSFSLISSINLAHIFSGCLKQLTMISFYYGKIVCHLKLIFSLLVRQRHYNSNDIICRIYALGMMLSRVQWCAVTEKWIFMGGWLIIMEPIEKFIFIFFFN